MPNLTAEELSHMETPHAFYEGKWVTTNYSVRSLKNILVKKERFFLRTMHPRRGTVLDLGCGGGWSFFTLFDYVVGLDISLTSLKQARSIYALPTQGAITRLPFADDSFDFVVSLDVLGHVAPQFKDVLLAEVYRVLKPGGATLHYIETLSMDPLSVFSRRYPDLHEKYVVAPEGHIGAELPSRTFERFRQAGFLPIHEIPAYKGFIYVDRFIHYFDNEYTEQSRFIRWAVTVLKPFVRYKPVTLAVNLLIALCFELLDPVLPDDWAGGALAYYQKPVIS